MCVCVCMRGDGLCDEMDNDSRGKKRSNEAREEKRVSLRCRTKGGQSAKWSSERKGVGRALTAFTDVQGHGGVGSTAAEEEEDAKKERDQVLLNLF